MSFFSTIKETVSDFMTDNDSKLFLAGSIVCGIGAIVTACIATKKMDKIVEDAEEELELIEAEYPQEIDGEIVEYTKKEEREIAVKRLKARGKLIGRTALAYAPAAVFEAASIACGVKVHNIGQEWKGNYVSAAAAYGTLKASFNKYRQNVIEDPDGGKEKDQKYLYGVKEVEVEEKTTDAKGKEKVTKKKKPVYNISGYAKFFDETNPNFKTNPQANIAFLQFQQATANMILKSRATRHRPGWYFLNEAHELLGLPLTEEGQRVGWIYDVNNPAGDNYIDFGISDEEGINKRFLNYQEPVAILDFNVDGVILNDRRCFAAI